MVGDCKIVLQSVQREGRLTIMMRIEHMKCYHDDDEGVDDVLLCIMMNNCEIELQNAMLVTIMMTMRMRFQLRMFI